MPVKIFNSGHQASQKLQSRNCLFSIWTARSSVQQVKPGDCRKAAIEGILVDLLRDRGVGSPGKAGECVRSEEHTSELQSLRHLVCRLLLEKKNRNRLLNFHAPQLVPRLPPLLLIHWS